MPEIPAAWLDTHNQEYWLVLDGDGQPIYCAGWSEACHEHINDAINEHAIDGAENWLVRRAELVPNASMRGATSGASLSMPLLASYLADTVQIA